MIGVVGKPVCSTVGASVTGAGALVCPAVGTNVTGLGVVRVRFKPRPGRPKEMLLLLGGTTQELTVALLKKKVSSPSLSKGEDEKFTSHLNDTTRTLRPLSSLTQRPE